MDIQALGSKAIILKDKSSPFSTLLKGMWNVGRLLEGMWAPSLQVSSGQQLGCGYQGCLGRIPRARDPYLSLGHILLRGSPVISRLSPLNNTFFFIRFSGSFKDNHLRARTPGWVLWWRPCLHVWEEFRVWHQEVGPFWDLLNFFYCPYGSGASHSWMAIPKLPWWWTGSPWQVYMCT